MIRPIRERLRQGWLDLNSSLWFVPASFVLAAIALAFALVWLQGRVGEGLSQRWPLVFGAGRDGSREMLAAIASSMISVAGVVFSVTIVALSLASSQYTPRLLRNFMSDSTTQRVLGIFVGIYVYCLIVLRTIYDNEDGSAFVPHLAVLGGLVLALVGVAFLVYFIHHIALSIQASHLMAAVARETERVIDQLYPLSLREHAHKPVASGASAAAIEWHSVPALRSGYVQRVDMKALFTFAKDRQVTLRMERGVGEFAVEGLPLFAVAGRVDRDESAALCRAFVLNDRRSTNQDVAFGMQQIADMALKALSPSVNDPTTAIMCIDRLEALLVRLADRHIEPAHRVEGGRWYVIARAPSFADLLTGSVDQIVENAAGMPAVLGRVLDLLESLLAVAGNKDRRVAITEQIERTLQMIRQGAPRSPGCRSLLDVGTDLLARARSNVGAPGLQAERGEQDEKKSAPDPTSPGRLH